MGKQPIDPKSVTTNFLEELVQFLLNGNFCDCDKDGRALLLSHCAALEETIYRGMQFPKEWIRVGQVIPEWSPTDCSHWSISEQVARNFTTSTDADDWFEEFGEEHGCHSLEESLEKCFTPTVLVLERPNDVLPAYLYLPEAIARGVDFSWCGSDNEDQQKILKEEAEVTVIGYNFVIQKIWQKDSYTYCSVSMEAASEEE